MKWRKNLMFHHTFYGGKRSPKTDMSTHSLSHAHFLCTFFLCDVQTRTRMAQGVCSVYVTSLHLALPILMFHPPFLLLPHGHFDTTFPSAPSSSSFTRPTSAGQAHLRTCAGKFGYLADPTHSKRHEHLLFLTSLLHTTIPEKSIIFLYIKMLKLAGPPVLPYGKHGSALSIRCFPRLRCCWRP